MLSNYNLLIVIAISCYYIATVVAFKYINNRIVSISRNVGSKVKASYLDELNMMKNEKRILVGLTMDSWQIGQKKYKDFLAVYKMEKRLQKEQIAAVECPMWEITQGPHFEELQRLLETFWIPDFTSQDHFLLQFDLIVVPDPVLAKYLVEAYYEKEKTVSKKKQYYENMMKQSWGVLDSFPPKERMDYERIKNLSKQKWIRKFPPLAAVGEDAYKRLKNHAQIEYFAKGVEDFAVHLPNELVPTKRALVLRYKNRFETLTQSLGMKGISCTSAYPVTWSRKQWNPQEERMAKEVDVVYFHESHAVTEWRERMGTPKQDPVAVCHDEEVAKIAKSQGFKDIFFAKQADSNGLLAAVKEAVHFAAVNPQGLASRSKA